MDNNRFAVLKTNSFKTNNTKKYAKEPTDKNNNTKTSFKNEKNSFKREKNSFKREQNSFKRKDYQPNNFKRNSFMNYTEKKEEKKPEFNFNNDDFPTLG